MLTEKQTELLEFIKSFTKEKLYSPTHREIKEGLNIKSCSYLNRVLDKLEDLNLIARKTKGTKKNIELLHSPFSLPLLGNIAAGSPIEAINQPEEVTLIQNIIGDDRYLLKVKGDSMIDDHICDGDLVICERCQKAPNGTIVVALINREEATLKRIYYEKNRICLEPANINHKTQVYKPEEVEVQGKFVGIIRLGS